MVNETLNEVMQRAATLNVGDKQTLAMWLLEQARQDALANTKLVAATNGTKPKIPDDIPDRTFQREYAWLKQHRHEYRGQYLLIEGDQLVSHGSDLREVYAEARQVGAKYPLLVRVEAADELPFGGW